MAPERPCRANAHTSTPYTRVADAPAPDSQRVARAEAAGALHGNTAKQVIVIDVDLAQTPYVGPCPDKSVRDKVRSSQSVPAFFFV